MAAGGSKERAEREGRREREAKVSEARAYTWLCPLATSPPPLHSLPASASPFYFATAWPKPRHTCSHHAIHIQRCPLAHPLARIPPLPSPRRTYTRLPRVCSGAVLAHADAAVARATRLANTLQSRPRLAEGGDRPGPHACDAADSARAGQPGATHTVHSSAFCSWRGGGPVGARQQVVCRLHRRVGAWADGWPCHPAPSHPPSQGGPGRIDRVTVDDHISASAGRRGGLWWRGQSERWVACSGPLTPLAGPAHHTHDAGRGQAHRPQLRVCSGAVLTHADPAVTRARWVERRRRRPARPVRVPMQK